jgi:peptidoglycan/xylan/chitin deacetylase (PgdA/CDA1 family)
MTVALIYHDVVTPARQDECGFPGPVAARYKLDPARFENHLDAIAATGASVGLIEDGPPAALPFDDGGASALHAAAALERRGWRGHFFITTDYIDASGFMTAAQLRDLHRRGHVVGSHSASHPARMSACTRQQLDHEWGGSVRRLEDLLGEQVGVASVPGGYYSRAVAESAAAAGVRVLFNSEPVTRVRRVDGCLVVGRFGVQQGVPASWAAAVVRGERVPMALRYLQWNGKKVLKTLGGELWLHARRRLIAARTGG